MALQDRLSQAARPAVHQQQQMLSIQTGLLKALAIDDPIHLLQFSEVVTAANRAQRAAPGMG
ncbi:Uncharacterised protein [Klebsiella pneumoniae]|nr:Uncharacterised protein [Klebsiella pneumoniae]